MSKQLRKITRKWGPKPVYRLPRGWRVLNAEDGMITYETSPTETITMPASYDPRELVAAGAQ